VKLYLSDFSILRIANNIGYTPDPECMNLVDNGICKIALRMNFEVQVPYLVESGSKRIKKPYIMKNGDVCPFAGEPPDPEDKYCRYYEESVGISGE
jgi:hypothetical protein